MYLQVLLGVNTPGYIYFDGGVKKPPGGGP